MYRVLRWRKFWEPSWPGLLVFRTSQIWSGRVNSIWPGIKIFFKNIFKKGFAFAFNLVWFSFKAMNDIKILEKLSRQCLMIMLLRLVLHVETCLVFGSGVWVGGWSYDDVAPVLAWCDDTGGWWPGWRMSVDISWYRESAGVESWSYDEGMELWYLPTNLEVVIPSEQWNNVENVLPPQ